MDKCQNDSWCFRGYAVEWIEAGRYFAYKSAATTHSVMKTVSMFWPGDLKSTKTNFKVPQTDARWDFFMVCHNCHGSIRSKILLAIAVTSTILMVTLAITSRLVVLDSFKEVEQRTVQMNVEQVLAKINYEIKALKRISSDWSGWDETYDFIQGKDLEYFERNFDAGILINLRLNMVAAMDRGGRVVEMRCFDLDTESLNPCPGYLAEKIAAITELAHPPDGGTGGIVLLNSEPMLIVSTQILTSNLEGPTKGALIMGRYLDATEIKKMSAATRLPFAIYPTETLKGQPDLQKIKTALSNPGNILVVPTDAQFTAGYALLEDIRHKPIFMLEVDVAREIYQTGQNTVFYYLLWILGIIIVFAILMLISLDRIVLSRLGKHSTRLAKLAQTGDLSLRLDVAGQDELSNLGITINEMIEALERFQDQKNKRVVRDLIDHSLIGICIVQNGYIVYSNPAFSEILDIESGRCKFESLRVHPEDAEIFTDMFRAIRENEVLPVDLEARFLASDETPGEINVKWVLMRAISIRYQGEKAILINMVDVTDFKEMERVASVREKMASLGNVAAGIAHEIRNPLSGINFILDSVMEYLESRKDAQEVNQLLIQSKQAVRKMEGVIRRVLDFTRQSSPRLVKTDINQPVSEAIGLVQTAMRKSNIHLQTNLERELPLVNIDAQLIEQVVLNLVTNAAEALRVHAGHKQITVATLKGVKHVLICIADSGSGIPPTIQNKIFDPFFTSKSNGSGIGLSLSQRIVADHGGSIEVTRAHLGGTEFQVKIPITRRKRSDD